MSGSFGLTIPRRVKGKRQKKKKDEGKKRRQKRVYSVRTRKDYVSRVGTKYAIRFRSSIFVY